MRSRLLILIFFLATSALHAQRISFSAAINDSSILVSEDDKLVSKLTFYISNLQLQTKNDSLILVKDYHLLDFSDTSSLVIGGSLADPNQEIKSIQFLLGIDSITSVSGVFGGALDPTKGMYWSWQSGYVNFKIEGELNAEKYILHLGGYSFPFKAVQKVELEVNKFAKEYHIVLPLDDLLNIEIPKDRTIMSPSKEAVEIAKQIASYFYVR